jgi:hypothetical protein
MHERKKKDGQRKDKKMQRMREDVERRKEEGSPKDFGTDQQDIQTFKPGSQNDRTVDPSAHRGGIGPTNKR